MPESSLKAKKRVILIIDDDENVLRSLRLVLMRKYEVHVTDNPKTGIQALGKIRPDVIVTDLKMPVHDGFWVYTQARSVNDATPVIFYSAYQDVYPPEDMRDSFKPFGVVTKNGSVEEFLTLINRAMDSIPPE